MRGPAKTGEVWGKARKVKEVTTPKFAPAPRIAQKRSGLRVLEQVRCRLDARTISTESRTSVLDVISRWLQWRGYRVCYQWLSRTSH
jgi:hypothetical protein